MSIIGVTHDKGGELIIRRTVTTKVAIGQVVKTQNGTRPDKLDHFIILRKDEGENGEPIWVEDETKTKHYGEEPRELLIVLLDDDVEEIFRTEYAWWGSAEKKCCGDGESAKRKVNGKWQPWENCANSGKCKEYQEKKCKPSGDLYFMLADFPSLGSVCRIHTTSYQSVGEVYTALNDLRNMFGGRLMGLPVKLFVRPERSSWTDKNGDAKKGTKYVLGMELRGESLPKMLETVSESARVFAQLRDSMRGRRLEIDEDDDERAPEIAGEFYPEENIKGALPASVQGEPVSADIQKKIEEFHALAEKAGLNKAQRHMLLGQHDGDIDKALASLPQVQEAGAKTNPPETTAAKPAKKKGRQNGDSGAPPPAQQEQPADQGAWKF